MKKISFSSALPRISLILGLNTKYLSVNCKKFATQVVINKLLGRSGYADLPVLLSEFNRSGLIYMTNAFICGLCASVADRLI